MYFCVRTNAMPQVVCGVFIRRKAALAYVKSNPDASDYVYKTSSLYVYSCWLESLRRRVFVRDNFRCVKCGRTVTWATGELHEKDSRGHGGSRTMENCEVLCGDCHTGAKGAHGLGKARKRIGGQTDEMHR